MRKRCVIFVGVAVGMLAGAVFGGTRMGPGRPAESSPTPAMTETKPAVIALPAPAMRGTVSLEEALRRRRSVREFAAEDLTLAQIGQLAWAAQGITNAERGQRTAPSAGALYPLTVYFVKSDGVYRYRAAGHVLLQLSAEDRRGPLAAAAGGQASVAKAPVDLVIAAAPERVKEKYGERAERFVCLEAGHVAQNVLLQAVPMGLAGVPVGAFEDKAVAAAVGLPAGETPLYLIPVGHPAGRSQK